MARYYTIDQLGYLHTYENYISASTDNDYLRIVTEDETYSVPIKDVVIHGDEEFWLNIQELLALMDRVMVKRMAKTTSKAVLCGFLYGSILNS